MSDPIIIIEIPIDPHGGASAIYPSTCAHPWCHSDALLHWGSLQTSSHCLYQKDTHLQRTENVICASGQAFCLSNVMSSVCQSFFVIASSAIQKSAKDWMRKCIKHKTAMKLLGFQHACHV